MSLDQTTIPTNRLDFPIIVHCHLRWDGVWQRPQQFLSRLSKRHRVLFVEGPLLVDEDCAPRYRLKPVAGFPNVTVMQTVFPHSRFHDGAWVDAERLRLLEEARGAELSGQFDRPVQWFYDPMAVVSFAGKLRERAIVYDCMDQLSQFKFAPPELIGRELKLLEAADVVFAGGRKLCEAKSRHNSNCYFYGCGVEIDHFKKARLPETAIPHDVAQLSGPILGYFGVVDERIDYDLCDRLATANPAWNVVMIGPAVKVSPESFPRRSNLHWLGRREYAQLPAYTKAFNVCLMPFALNEATEYINPTKALEYMATGRPIISTGVPDVISNFGSVVKIAESHDHFIELSYVQTKEPDETAISNGLKMAEENGWDCIVEKLESHVHDAIAKKQLRLPRKTKSEALLTKSLAANF